MKNRVNPFVLWAPRIISIAFILFLMMFSLDVFDGKHTFWEYVSGFLIHNIPAAILLIVLIISWKYQLVGAITYVLAGLFYLYQLLVNSNLSTNTKMIWFAGIGLPAILIGLLFFLTWLQKRKIVAEG